MVIAVVLMTSNRGSRFVSVGAMVHSMDNGEKEIFTVIGMLKDAN